MVLLLFQEQVKKIQLRVLDQMESPHLVALDTMNFWITGKREALIQRGMETLMKGRTSFVIAHRLSTLRRANRLVVLDHGRIAEMGTHDDLLAAGGAYARLYHAQQKAAEEAAAAI